MENLNQEFYKGFIDTLKVLLPQRGSLCQQVMDILRIEKTSAYRRLRGDVPFTLAEIIVIARKLNISLDKIIGITGPYRAMPFTFYRQDYFNLTESDYRMSEDYIKALQAASFDPQSEFGCACNNIPLNASVLYPSLFRFLILKWTYQFGRQKEITTFSHITVPKRLAILHKEYLKANHEIKRSYIVFHEHSISNMINDILYFKEINLLGAEDIKIIKSDINAMISRLDHLAITGQYETGNSIEFLVSGVNFETSYTYLSANKIYVSMIDAFTLGAVTSIEDRACELTKQWVKSIKRTAVSISDSERQRVKYIERQRELLKKL
jgi:hypothetical protein